jgi:hypothetical protein
MSSSSLRNLRFQVRSRNTTQLNNTSSNQSDKLPRPTNKRIPSLGIRGHMSGKEAMMSTPGPMTTDRASLELIMKAALASEPWRLDPSVTFKPWTPVTFTKPLKIAVQWWDGVVTPHPPMRRALKEVAEACRKAGMKVVDWDCEKLDHKKGWEIISSLYWPDGGEQILNSMKESGEPVLPLSKWIIEQPSVKNMTQQELWNVSTYPSSDRPTSFAGTNQNPSAPPNEKPTAPPTPKPGPPPQTQTETGKK